jgi:chromosome segregation ATPase
MQANKKTALLMTQTMLMFLLSACGMPQGPVKIVFPPDPAQHRPSGAASKRFQEPVPQEQTVVGSAMELSEKYTKLSEDATAMRQQNQNLIAENNQLKEQLNSSQSRLQKTQEELTQANDLLIEMRIELNNWKTDVIGFRDEMRDAEKAQLEALFKILGVLGGKIKPKSAQVQEATPAEISQNQLSQAQPQENLTSGL